MTRHPIDFLGWIAAFLVMALIPTSELLSDDQVAAKPPAAAPPATAWVDLKLRDDGHWKASRFGGDGEIVFQDGVVTLGFGDPLTGIYWEGPHPKIDYEISLEARRTAGFDFFCGLTVPVEDERCSLILGGWGGSLIGISSVDGRDAAENETMQFLQFEQDKWYRVRMRVSRTHLRVWLDDKEIIELARAGRRLDIRPELEFSVPLGVASYQCEGQIRKIRYRELAASEKQSSAVDARPAPAAGQEAQGD